MNRNWIWLCLLAALTCTVRADVARGPDGSALIEKQPDPKTVPLSEALGDWVGLLEKGEMMTANSRWAADEKAAEAIAREWNSLRKAHERHDYRKWLDERGVPGGAKQIADRNHFTVGAHDYDHRHIDWVKTDSGWRIKGIRLCR